MEFLKKHVRKQWLHFGIGKSLNIKTEIDSCRYSG